MSNNEAHSPGPSSAPAAVMPTITATAAVITDQVTKGPITKVSTSSSIHDTPDVGHPQEQLEIDESGNAQENHVYPSGSKLWLTYLTMMVALFLNGLDMAIVAVAIPSLTDQFHTVADIGWYSAAYGVVYSACGFFFGKCYTLFPTKYVYVTGLIIFLLGSIICTFAKSSKVFVMGRAVAGFGACAYGAGFFKILRDLFPMSKQALMTGFAGGSQITGLISAPMVGGLLIGRFSWRACFGINIPLGVLCIAFTMWGFEEATTNPDIHLPFKEKIKRMDLVSTLLVIPTLISLLLGLQWGGLKYGWRDWRIILLFVVFGVLASAFAYLQYRQGEGATVPPRLIKSRSILGAVWYSACTNGILAMTEAYISIYYQGVRGYSPTKSGLFSVSMLVGFLASWIFASTGTTIIGYYYPFLFATSILAPIASGLLTTIDLDGSMAKPIALLGFVGFAVGLGQQGPGLAVQTTCVTKDVPLAGAITACGGGLGSALWICVAASLFQNRLSSEILKLAPGTNATVIEQAGLAQLRTTIGSDKLRDVLAGYNTAVVQTLYLPLGLAILTIIGSFAMERKSIKEKRS